MKSLSAPRVTPETPRAAVTFFSEISPCVTCINSMRYFRISFSTAIVFFLPCFFFMINTSLKERYCAMLYMEWHILCAVAMERGKMKDVPSGSHSAPTGQYPGRRPCSRSGQKSRRTKRQACVFHFRSRCRRQHLPRRFHYASRCVLRRNRNVKKHFWKIIREQPYLRIDKTTIFH